MRTVCEQYLWKGPRVLYHVALREDAGKLALLFRWENHRSAGSRETPCSTEDGGRALFEQKVTELGRRGYEKRARILPRDSATASAPAPRVEAEVRPPAEADGLENQLRRRRREAAWSIE